MSCLVGSPMSKYAYGVNEKDLLQGRFLWIINTESGLPEHRIRSELLAKATEETQRARSDFVRQKISELAITRDGRYLIGRMDDHCCRFRIEGSDLVFEERTPAYLMRRETHQSQLFIKGLNMWVSGDSAYFSPLGGSRIPSMLDERFEKGKKNISSLLEKHFGKGELIFTPGSAGRDIFMVNDFSKPIESLAKSGNEDDMPEAIRRRTRDKHTPFTFDSLNKAFVVQSSEFGLDFSTSAYFLPKSNLLFGSGYIKDFKKFYVSVRHVEPKE